MNAPLIRLSGIRYRYLGAEPTLDGLDFELSPGERIAVAGSNGAGKTTLLHIIVGLRKPESGIVWAFGREREKEADFREVRIRAGLLFQDADDQLFCPTVGEDIAFGPLNIGKSAEEAKAIARRTLARLGLEGFEDRVTHRLSGGQRRLVSLAAVLAMEPDVLLLDEPTTALDATTQARLTDILKGLPQSLVVVSHDEAFLAQVTDRRLTLDRGKLTEV